MDPRQFATLIKYVIANFKDGNYQYIASVNENTLNDVKKYFSEDEYKNVLSNIILPLTDESPESKLLGIQIDIDYDSNRKKVEKIK